MIRSVNLCSRETFLIARNLSTQASFKLKDKEYDEAKKFDEIPGLSKLELIRRFMPGGKFHQCSIIETQNILREEFGDFYRLPGMFGQPTVLSTFNADDVEFVHRNEGIYPFRRGLQTMKHYREKVRPDIFDVGGLIIE